MSVCIYTPKFLHTHHCCTQGCTIYKQGEAVFVGKLLKGCDAELSGEFHQCSFGRSQTFSLSFSFSCATEVLREGDELLEVNGVPVMRRSTDEIVRLMVSHFTQLFTLFFTCGNYI